MPKGKTVFEVLYDGPDGGPAGDGTYVARFARIDDARAFACRRTLWGRPLASDPTGDDGVRRLNNVPRRLTDRWGI